MADPGVGPGGWAVPAAAADGPHSQPRGGDAPAAGWGGADGVELGRGRGAGGGFGGGGAGGYGLLGGGAFDDPDGDDGDDDPASRAATRVANAFDAAAVDYVYHRGPRIQGFERPPRLQRAGTFPAPFRPTGDTAFAAEFNNGSRNAIEAEVLYMACT